MSELHLLPVFFVVMILATATILSASMVMFQVCLPSYRDVPPLPRKPGSKTANTPRSSSMLLMWDVMALTISCGKIIFRAFLPPTYFAHCRVVRSAMVRASGCEGLKVWLRLFQPPASSTATHFA